MQLDIVGKIYKNDGEYSEDGGVIKPPTEIDGFHVNFPYSVPELEQYLVDPQPTTPYRVYAGGKKPVSYKFADEQEWLSVLDQHSDEDGNLLFTPPPPKPPKQVTRRQFIQQMIYSGIRTQVETALDNIQDVTEREIIKAWYEESQVFEIDRPELNQMIKVLGFDKEYRDEFFRQAGKL